MNKRTFAAYCKGARAYFNGLTTLNPYSRVNGGLFTAYEGGKHDAKHSPDATAELIKKPAYD